MAHLERNLDSESACGGDSGSYVASTYFLTGRQTKWKQVELGRYSTAIETPSSVIAETAERLASLMHLGAALPLEDIAAVSIMRECLRRRHDYGPASQGIRLERVASYALARNKTDIEEIAQHPYSQIRQISAHGFGSARRTQPGLMGIQNLIYLPVTAVESRSYEVSAAVRALPTSATLGEQPYVALHTLPGGSGTIEEIVSLDELR